MVPFPENFEFESLCKTIILVGYVNLNNKLDFFMWLKLYQNQMIIIIIYINLEYLPINLGKMTNLQQNIKST